MPEARSGAGSLDSRFRGNDEGGTLFSFARDFAPANVAAAESGREIDPVDRGIGARLRLGDALARCGDVQHATARGDDRPVRPRGAGVEDADAARSEEHTSEIPSLMRNSYAVFCLKKKITKPAPVRRQTIISTVNTDQRKDPT